MKSYIGLLLDISNLFNSVQDLKKIESGGTMSATTTPSLSLSNFRPRFRNPTKTNHLSPLSWSASRRKILSFDRQQAPRILLLHQEKTQLWSLSATPEEISQEIVSSDTSSSEAIVSTGGQDGVALIIQVLLIVAFLALSVLTIGVSFIYKPKSYPLSKSYNVDLVLFYGLAFIKNRT